MRDLVAGVVAVALVFVALSLAGTLQGYRRRRRRAREHERRARPDDRRRNADRATTWCCSPRTPATSITAIASVDKDRHRRRARADQRLADRERRVEEASRRRWRRRRASRIGPEGIARDRWDVAIETSGRHDAGRVRRDPRARVAGTGTGGVRRGEAERRGLMSRLLSVFPSQGGPSGPPPFLTRISAPLTSRSPTAIGPKGHLRRRSCGANPAPVAGPRCEDPSGRWPASSVSWPGPLSLLARSGDRGRRPANGFAPHLRQRKRASRLGGEIPGLRAVQLCPRRAGLQSCRALAEGPLR